MKFFNRFIEWRKPQKQKELENTEFKYIVVGAGTGGCITAYTLAKQLEESKTPGRVLLVDGGKAYVQADGPHPKMWQWFDNWSKFSVVHETLGIGYLPAPASSHLGVGGCGAHDTRITFYPTSAQRSRMANRMGWTSGQMTSYLQMALDLMPLQSAGCGEKFYDAVLQTLGRTGTLKRVDGDEFKAKIVQNAAAYVSIAMWPDETRWTSAYLLEDGVRPKNLDILTEYPVNKVIFDANKRAIGISGGKTPIRLDISDDASEVIVTAGSLGTPAILQRSGIGPRFVCDRLGITPIVINEEVGHGVDHTEIAVTYEWLPQWTEQNGKTPRGGPMAWPIVMFIDDGVMAHFGISPPPYGGNEVTATPNCMRPDPTAGFRAVIQSTDPLVPIQVIHADPIRDMKTLIRGVKKTVSVMDVLQANNIVGKRISPAALDDKSIEQYIRSNANTAFHWMSTCKAGVDASTTVADEKFRVRGVKGLRIGSGAVLPEITEANPHLTISAFSIALAYAIGGHTPTPTPLFGINIKPQLTIRREGNNAALASIASMHRTSRGKD
jgi:choline dehydrogenase-like flavoprotein